MPENTTRYALLRDVGVRAAIAYFGAFWVSALFDTGTTPRRIWQNTWGVPRDWLAQHLFGETAGANAIRISDAQHAVAEHVLAIAVAMTIALFWAKASSSTNSQKREGALRLMLRYYMGIVVMIYAGAKVVPVQFPQLTIEDMERPIGALAPMGLLWAFMGYSPAYAVFAGLAEWFGAFLLFFRRTTTLGALILLGVLSNVAFMNYAYNVPVKLLSVNLSLMAATLVALDAGRLLDVFWFNKPTFAAELAITDVPRWLIRARPFLKPLLVVMASIGPIAGSLFIYRNVIRARSPLYGVYAVMHDSTQTRNEFSAWKHVTFARPSTMTVTFGSDSIVRFQATLDTTAHTIRYRDMNGGVSGSAARTLQYRRETAGGLVLIHSGDSVGLLPIDPMQRYRMLR